MKDDLILRIETPADCAATENLTREAFWNVYRPGCTEHYVLHSFRGKADFVPELSLVMELGGTLIGHIMYVRSQIRSDSGAAVPVMTFGPLSIAPAYQRQGYGTILLRESMRRAALLGAGALAIEGAIGFYGKSGFTVASARGIHYAAEPRDAEVPYFLLCELKPGFLDGITGTYQDPAGYFVDEAEAERFDAQFPPKEKQRLPGQLC
ncbi:MAG: N-acetyltransferase [Oscillospiraceae bacterium]|nr:N-acetyltransferase [Oscillospiraceae bacterium]